MQLRFLPHAVERMLERKVSVAEVEEIIQKPDGRILQSKDKSILYKRFRTRKDNFVAAVVVEETANEVFEVVTILVNFEVKK